MERYEKYKDSGVEWIGEIPEEWEIKKIRRLSIVKRGASPRPISDPMYFDDNGEWAWVRIADVSASKRYLENTTQRLSDLGASLSVKMMPGSIFLSIAGTVGKPIITKIKCCIHDGFVYFPYLTINPEFLYYIFSTGLPYQGLGKWGTQLNLNTDTVGEINIPLSSSKSTEKIVGYLDRKTAEIDDLIAQKECLIELYEEEKAAIINQAVTKGIDPKAKLKASGVDWIGEIPESWEVFPIKIATEIYRGKFGHRPRNDPNLYCGEYPFIQTGDIARAGKYVEEYHQTLNDKGYSVSQEFPVNTLVMTIAANVGDLAILSFSACFPDSIVGFYPLKGNSADFLYYLFTSMKTEF